MSEQDVGIVRSAYESFNKGDIPGVLATYDEKSNGSSPAAAPRRAERSRDQTKSPRTCSRPSLRTSTSSRPTSMSSTTRTATVIIKGRFKGKNKSGAELDAPFEHHQRRWSDGKLVRFENKVDQDAWAAGWS